MDTHHELPIFPASAPAVFRNPDVTADLFDDVLGRLADVVDIGAEHHDQPTPCDGFTVAELQQHVLGWLGFFAEALADPSGARPRSDPDAFTLAPGASASDHVRTSLNTISQSIDDGVMDELVVMSAARMSGDAVLAMALGEYITHAWDLAVATGREYTAPDAAVRPAHEFLRGMVAPEYRGPNSGFFDDEVAVADTASALDQLLGFAGRDPAWRRPA